MLRIEDKIAFFKLERLWFTEVADAEKRQSKSDLLRTLRSRNEPHAKKYLVDTSYTVFTDLTEDAEVILSKVRKKVRYEINRALNEEFQIRYFEAVDLRQNVSVVDEFEKAYMDFCDVIQDKKVRKAYSRKKIDGYIKNDCITLSTIEKDNCTVFHLYVHDEASVVLLYSVSNFRDRDVDQNLSGRANKLLHYKDILYFKDMELKTYDWGNISSIENPNGIDNFKKSFGGEIGKVYNVLIGSSIWGKAVVCFLKTVMGFH